MSHVELGMLLHMFTVLIVLIMVEQRGVNFNRAALAIGRGRNRKDALCIAKRYHGIVNSLFLLTGGRRMLKTNDVHGRRDHLHGQLIAIQYKVQFNLAMNMRIEALHLVLVFFVLFVMMIFPSYHGRHENGKEEESGYNKCVQSFHA